MFGSRPFHDFAEDAVVEDAATGALKCASSGLVLLSQEQQQQQQQRGRDVRKEY